MKRIRVELLLAAFTILFAGLNAAAQYTPRASNRQVRDLLIRIETKTDTFRETVGRSSRFDNTIRDDSIMTLITDFENATNQLRRDLDARMNYDAQVSEVLNRASSIDDFLNRSRMRVSVQSQWRSLRTDLSTLARYAGVAWNWNRPDTGYPGTGYPGRMNARLTGTYRLNTSMSDNVSEVLDRSLGAYNANERDRFRGRLERRLTAPDELAIEQNGRNITMASNLSQQVTFQADGITRTETTPRGRTVRTTASTSRSGFTVNTQGDRASDFWVSFEPEGFDRLRVTRRLYLENLNQTITATSVYDRTDRIARWPVIDRRPDWNDNTGVSGFYIPNGTRLTAVLQNMVSSRTSQPGDRFTMEITSPSSYRGAIIEGRVAQVESSGRLTGRANLSLEFDSLSHNGRTYRFAGIVDSAREADGDVVSITNEGTVRDSSQTKRTVTRAGIGAALGAIIGAIAGGGSGAAIGAGVGAGAGAGSVLIQGRDNIELQQGSEFMITATAPSSVGWNR